MNKIALLAAALVLSACDSVLDGGAEGETAEGEGEGEAAEGEGEGELPPPPVACEAPDIGGDVDGATIVGDGTAASCTSAAVVAAVSSFASVAFSCGPDAITIALDDELVVASDLVIDGGGLVTLSGNGAHRVLRLDSTFDQVSPHVTLQHLGITQGTSDGDGSDTLQGGGGVFRLGGTLDVLDCTFTNNHAPTTGQDVAGGAISSIGGGATTIVGSTFANNSGSNGGALGNLGSALVVVNSVFVDNSATGTGGNPGNGGNGGTISVDGEFQNVELCGVGIDGSHGNAFGGAFFRVGYHQETTTMHNVVVTDASIDDRAPSMGGALYVQNNTFSLTSSTIRLSRASAAGGAYVGPGSSIRFENVTFDSNVASSSLAGAMFLDGVTGGSIDFSTFVGNAAPGPVAFGGAVTGDASRVTLTSSLFIDNAAGNGFNPITCTTSFLDGSNSFQFPVVRAGNGGGDGGSDDPQSLCAPNIRALDVDMDALDAAGVVPVRRPAAGSAAVNAVASCTGADALGVFRTPPCSSGAVEVDEGA